MFDERDYPRGSVVITGDQQTASGKRSQAGQKDEPVKIGFAPLPIFRGATPGTARVLLNAIVYGSGLGASHPVRP